LKTNDKSLRLFVAIELPPEVREAVCRITATLKTKVEDVRWINVDGIHITLKFLGSVSSPSVETVEKAIGPLCSAYPSFDLSLGALGAFPGLDRPRVIWAALDGETERLTALQGEIEKRCADIGFPEEKRIYTPHLTLGRVKSYKGSRKPNTPEEVFRAVNFTDIPRFRALSVHLYKSDLTPEGAVYTKLKTFPLKGEDQREV